MKRTYLVLIITMLVIGFASVATNLAINGTINFGFNQNDFSSNVIFTYAKAKNGDANITGDDKKSITFNTIKLEDVNQEAILEYDIANKSSQYDARVTITCGLEKDSESYQEYLKLHNSLENEFELNSGETITGYLTITLIKAYNETLIKDLNMICTIIATPGERDTEGTYTPVDHEYEEILLKGADPVLEATPVEEIALAAETNDKKLIPVKIDENGNVTRADTTKEWYNYEKKVWANAVILVDGVEDPGPEGQIKEDQIESYFVWIPKYRYKIFDMGKYTSLETEKLYSEKSQPIQIEFGTEDTNDNENECIAPSSGEDGNCEVGKWMTHPAFTTFGVNGFWVGKFETGYNQNGIITTWTKEGAEINENNSSKVIIKPNVYSWRNITIANAHLTSYKYQRNLDSHLIKNTEWGAVAYLSHSEYGTCTNNICEEVRLNNSQNLVTGVSAKQIPVLGVSSYKDFGITELNMSNDKSFVYPESQEASTTLNNSGIFDMSGGSRELTFGILEINGNTFGDSGFTEQSFPQDYKYYDLYKYDLNQLNYSKRILGDATGELGDYFKNDQTRETSSWYRDEGYFPYSNSFFIFSRGALYNGGTAAGLFAYHRTTGGNDEREMPYSFRIVLSPQ